MPWDRLSKLSRPGKQQEESLMSLRIGAAEKGQFCFICSNIVPKLLQWVRHSRILFFLVEIVVISLRKLNFIAGLPFNDT